MILFMKVNFINDNCNIVNDGKTNMAKDLDMLEDTAGMKKYMRGLIRKGKARKEVVQKTSEKFEVPTKIVRQLYKTLTQ